MENTDLIFVKDEPKIEPINTSKLDDETWAKMADSISPTLTQVLDTLRTTNNIYAFVIDSNNSIIFEGPAFVLRSCIGDECKHWETDIHKCWGLFDSIGHLYVDSVSMYHINVEANPTGKSSMLEDRNGFKHADYIIIQLKIEFSWEDYNEHNA